MIVISGEAIIGWCIGVAAWGLLLLGLHFLCTAIERRKSNARAAFQARIRKHVRKGVLWS